MTKDELLDLVSNGKEMEAIQHLLELTKDDYFSNNNVILFSARLNRNNQMAQRGLMPKDKAKEEYQIIIESLKDFIQEHVTY